MTTTLYRGGDTMEQKPKSYLPPYVAFRTFLTALEHLEQGLPNQIDRSVWPSFSGASQGHLIAAFKFLGLIDDNNQTQPILERLVEDKENRKAILQQILKEKYADLFSIGLTKASPKQLDEAMAKYGVKGSTHQKAISFFLQAAQYAELPLSPFLTNKVRSLSLTKRRKGTKSRDTTRDTITTTDENLQTNDSIVAQAQGHFKTVKLRSGGSLTLSASINIFDMTAEDRQLLFELIDKLNSYELEKNEIS